MTEKTRAETWMDVLAGANALLEEVQNLKAIVEEAIEKNAEVDENAGFTPSIPIALDRDLFTRI